MATKQLILLITMVLSFSTFQAGATTAGQLNSIKRMGQLNGVALHCKYFNEMRRMKQALIAVLPKRRQLGQTFDDVTNESFLSFIQNKLVCPVEEQFILKVNAAVVGLNKVFPKP